MEDKPDYVAEAASVKSIKDYAKNILCQGASLVVLSIGAFADQEFYEQAKTVLWSTAPGFIWHPER